MVRIAAGGGTSDDPPREPTPKEREQLEWIRRAGAEERAETDEIARLKLNDNEQLARWCGQHPHFEIIGRQFGRDGEGNNTYTLHLTAHEKPGPPGVAPVPRPAVTIRPSAMRERLEERLRVLDGVRQQITEELERLKDIPDDPTIRPFKEDWSEGGPTIR